MILMNRDEAIRLLDPKTTREALAEIEYYGGFSGHDACIRAIEDACMLAVEALKRQIPKEPICIEDKMWVCPVCSNNLLNKWVKYPTKLVPKSAGLPYCLNCGQAIDWSDIDWSNEE